MNDLAADLRYALRMLRGNAGFTFIALAALALGIGANTAILTVVNAVLLQPLPYTQPDRMVKLARKQPNGLGYSISVPKFMAWRRNHVFEATALYGQTAAGLNLGVGDRPESVRARHVSEGYFKVFGVGTVLGRTFLPAEDLPGRPRVVVLSHSLSQSHFRGDARILGSNIQSVAH